ncbi:hypothetical protein, partial [Anaerotruncus colihominis]|uniref:hypothetical protein n=1 Tax=Anaerotruncus colihominis TaxID=169435 RepID=UPI003992EC04
LEKRQDPRGALPFFSPAAFPKRRAKTFIRCGVKTDYETPAPLFAAQPTKVFRRGLFSKRPERSRLKFFAEAFFQKGRNAADQSFSPRPFFKKAGTQPTKVFCRGLFQKGRSAAD